MFNEPDMMNQIIYTVGTVLYERLKKKVYTYDPKPVLSMVAEAPIPYGKDKK